MSEQNDERIEWPEGVGFCPEMDFSNEERVSIYSTEPNILWRTIRNYRLAWSVAAVAIAAAIYAGFFRGEWRPTGDGTTVIHSRTGEVREVSEARRPTSS
jgi:hypothetical protein